MSSVTQRVAEVKQPKGGYLKLSKFQETEYSDGILLNEKENLSTNVVGSAVKYLTMFSTGETVEQAFAYSMLGARIANSLSSRRAVDESWKFIRQVQGLDDTSIVNACKLASFDVWHTSTISAVMSKSAEETVPDKGTIENIRTMVNRSISLFDTHGGVVKSGFDFGDGYTTYVKSGTGDFLTKTCLWCFKPMKTRPTIRHTLQLLMSYLLCTNSGLDIFSGVTDIGIFNPRLNMSWVLPVDWIDESIISEVKSEVIYGSDVG